MPLFGPPEIDSLKAKGDIKGLEKAAADKDNPERALSAVKALEELATPPAAAALISLFTGTSSTITEAASAALTRLGAPAVDELIQALVSPDQTVRFRAANCLYLIGDRRAVPALITCLSDPYNLARQAAARGLGKFGDERGVPALIARLAYTDYYNIDTCRACLYALAQIGDKRAFQPLLTFIQSKSIRSDLRKAAGEALISFYKAGTLTPEEKSRLLSFRSAIEGVHTDNDSGHDDMSSNFDNHTDETVHRDEWEGVPFPL